MVSETATRSAKSAPAHLSRESQADDVFPA